MEDELLTLKEFARKIFYSERHVRQMCIDGKIHAKKITDDARKWLIPASELERLKAGGKLGREANLKPYEETPHKQKIRDLAGELRNEISLPRIPNSFIVDWKPQRILHQDSRANRLCPSIIIAKKRTISIELSIEGDGEIDHLHKGLRSHLETGGFSEVLTEIDNWENGLGQYAVKCNDLLKIAISKKKVQDNFPDDEVERNEKPGYQKNFFASACADAIEIACGKPLVTDSGYCRQINAYNLWNLIRYGSGSICVANTQSQANERQCEHQELVAGLSETKEAKETAKLRLDLERITEKIKKQLQKFIDMERVPGYCELCVQ